MSLPKILAVVILSLCATTAYFSWVKIKPQENLSKQIIKTEVKQEIPENPPKPNLIVIAPEKEVALKEPVSAIFEQQKKEVKYGEIDRIPYLFKKYPPLLPIVETITYSSKVDWLKGRPAYLGDYASYFQTSKHFISRSLKGQVNYFSQNVSNGDRFNVFKKDKNIQFHLVLDLSVLKLWFYYFDVDAGQRVLLKTYKTSAGKPSESRESGYLTPVGLYSLGSEVAIYKEGVMGLYNNKSCEMITVFGNRWIPFDKEIENCTASAKGLGIHGMPWKRDEKTDKLVEVREGIGAFESSGCIRLLTEDIEEIFSIIITKPSFIHIVHHFNEAKLPGNETFPEL